MTTDAQGIVALQPRHLLLPDWLDVADRCLLALEDQRHWKIDRWGLVSKGFAKGTWEKALFALKEGLID